LLRWRILNRTGTGFDGGERIFNALVTYFPCLTTHLKLPHYSVPKLQRLQASFCAASNHDVQLEECSTPTVRNHRDIYYGLSEAVNA